jgi:ABC-type transport system substrate-binding protein
LGGEDILVNAYDAGFNYRIADLPEGVPGTQISLPGDEGVEGGLFESWEFSEDETVITLHIRRGVQSYFGNEFTSDDFVWRVNRAWNTGFIGRFQYEAAGITDPSDVRVIDDYTLEITTPNGPNPVFFKSLATVYAAPVDADELLENWVTDEDPWAVDAFRQHTFGYGPYHLESCTPGTGCTLVANPNYWRGRPYWDRIVWREVPDASARYALLQSGEVQYVFNSLTYEQMSQLRDGPQDEASLFEMRQGNEGIYFAMNVTQPPFDNPQLRQAIAYAIPYDDIVNIAYRGFGVLAESIVPSMYTDADMDAWTYEQDLERARELWETAGGPDAFEIMVDSSRPVDQDAAVLIKTSLAEIGVTANIRSVPTAAFWEAFNGKTHQSLITMSLAFVADANYCGFLIFHGGGGLNAAGYGNEEVDSLIDDSLIRAPDDPVRTEDASAWQAIVAEDVPEIPMIYHGFAVGLSRGLTGTVWYFDNHARWDDLRWSE